LRQQGPALALGVGRVLVLGVVRLSEANVLTDWCPAKQVEKTRRVHKTVEQNPKTKSEVDTGGKVLAAFRCSLQRNPLLRLYAFRYQG
jgi:hypothetical protein